MTTSMSLMSITMFTLAVITVTVFSLHSPIAVFLAMSSLLPVSISMSFSTVNVSMFTLAVVAVAVGTLHYAGTATTMATTMAIGTKDAGDKAQEKDKGKVD